jgi:very-short-patch-repair endonuclease
MVRKRLTTLAQRHRREPTEAERRLWLHLRGKQLGVGFTREFPIGDYIVDLASRSARLVIEVDGGQHADSEADLVRTREIEAFGYTVIRFWNRDVLSNTDGVLTVIAEHLAIARNRNTWFEN